jgi:hypothetical protein
VIDRGWYWGSYPIIDSEWYADGYRYFYPIETPKPIAQPQPQQVTTMPVSPVGQVVELPAEVSTLLRPAQPAQPVSPVQGIIRFVRENWLLILLLILIAVLVLMVLLK